jgi:hypothetical protein
MLSFREYFITGNSVSENQGNRKPGFREIRLSQTRLIEPTRPLEGVWQGRGVGVILYAPLHEKALP